MGAQEQHKVYQDFTAGLNDRPSSIQLKENEAHDLENVVVNDRGILEKAKGFIKDGEPYNTNDPEAFIRMLLNLKRGISVDILIMAAKNNALAAPQNIEFKKTIGDGVYTSLGVPYWHEDFIPRGIVFNNVAIFTNGQDNPMTYDNTALTNIADPDVPFGRYIEAHKNRVFIASTASFPSRVFWSAVNDEQTWDPASFEDIFPQDNGTIVAIKSFGDSLIVFKNGANTNSIYQIVGDFDQDEVGEPIFIRRIDTSDHVGIIAERSIVVHNGLLYFLSETGLFVIDQRMGIEKVTFNIDNFIATLNFALGPTSSRAFTFDSRAEWNTGTNSGTRADSSGNLMSVFDNISITDAMQGDWIVSSVIDSNNDVHIAYVSSSNSKQIRYAKWLFSDQSISNETVFTSLTSTIGGLSIDVNNIDEPAIAFAAFDGNAERFRFTQRTTSWSVPEVVFDITGAGISTHALGFKYDSANVPFIAVTKTPQAGGAGLTVFYKPLASWLNLVFFDTGVDSTLALSLALNASDRPRIALKRSVDSTVRFFYTDNLVTPNEGSSFTESNPIDRTLQIQINSAGKALIGLTDGNTIKKFNATDNTSATLVAASTGQSLIGYDLDSTDRDYVYYRGGTAGENYLFENTSTIANPVSGLSSTAYTVNGTFSHNGPIYSSASFGANVNEIVLRRLAFRGIWTGPLKTDTISMWGTYEVIGQVENSASVLHEVAVDNVPPTTFVTITPGQVISPAATDNQIINRITFVLGTFAAPQIGSIIDNYTGLGVDSKQAIGISFKNELYEACSSNNPDSNNKTLILDKFGSFLKQDFPVSSLEIFKKKLYAGRSSNGDLLILQQGYNYAGQPYFMDFQFKEDFLNSIELEKHLYKIYILFEVKPTGSFDFSYRLDSFKTFGGSTYRTVTIDQTVDGFYELPIIEGKGRDIQCRITNNNVDDQVGLIAFVFVFGNLHIR